MSKQLKGIGEEYRKATNDSFISVVRSVGQINKGLQGIASEMVVRSVGEINKGLRGIASEMTEHSRRSIGRAFEMQAQLAKKAYEGYISELTKLGQMMFSGYGTFLARAEERFPNADHPQLAFRGAAQRTAAHSITVKRKTGTVQRSRSSAKRAKTKRAKTKK